MKHHHHIQQGFTLFELLVVLGIAAILVSLALPAYLQLIQQERHTQAVNQLQAMYKFARSEAIKRNKQVNIVAGAGGNWQVELPDQQDRSIRSFQLKDAAIAVTGLDLVNVSQAGFATPASVSISHSQHTDAAKWLCIFPSGQLTIQSQACTHLG
ncbi:prepilin-type N-terminal cleavage/methylation domain-containing protein [Rheinheimera riviphila]|uniref:Type II secretion system protein H n=1 Tax=Rheinheimera riviphila TaxID=1834037 RepID=A0A437QFN3_9GAMM|nr:GspH/FimT family pseudopilin [Rheinheimera riviphila]RVU33369.1 prepilin-type N-terminal cleavage/methylation domain-containing protein [Rheinheimera riviphila]